MVGGRDRLGALDDRDVLAERQATFSPVTGFSLSGAAGAEPARG
jgi:hypothetical protein